MMLKDKKMEIRPAKIEDVPFCAALEMQCFSEPWSENSLRNAVMDSDTYFFVVVSENKLVGYFVAGNICDEINLYTIAVSPDVRGQGFGDALIAKLKDIAAQYNAIFIGLEVRPSNTNAVKLYERHGFLQTGRRPSFYRKPTEDALLYTLDFREENV